MESEGNSKHKIKANNSYESEPSSGSGSSLSEHNDHVSDDENMYLPYLLNPSNVKCDDDELGSANLLNNPQITLVCKSLPQQKLTTFRRSTSSESKESLFRGFGDSPFGLVNKAFYGSQYDNLKLPEPPKESYNQKIITSKSVFPKFYDTIIEENSCNAVDLPLSTTNTAHNKTNTKIHENSKSNHIGTALELTVNLSFNGKIKNLTENLKMQPTTDSDEAPSTSKNCQVSSQRNNFSPVPESSLNASQLADNSLLKKYSNERSPDIFAESDDNDEQQGNDDEVKTLEKNEEIKMSTTSSFLKNSVDEGNPAINKTLECSFNDEQTLESSAAAHTMCDDSTTLFLNNCRRERELLRRIRHSLGGVRPPPSVTIPQIDMFTTVVNMKTDILNFLSNSPHKPAQQKNLDDVTKTAESLFKPTHSLVETQSMSWRDILGVRQHGLSYNINKAAEHNEYLSLSVIDRYVGSETATSFNSSPSSAKKRNTRLKLLMQSPGNRLSHLAKRRAVFSSANLATNSLKLNQTIGPQIFIDNKKAKNKRKATPKRMTPGSKRKNRKTPTSSARKRLYRCDLIKPGPSRETSKRALFQSPAKALQQPIPQPPKPQIKPEIATRVEKSKRALFSPEKTIDHLETSFSSSSSSRLQNMLKRKRNTDEDSESDELASQSSKLFRGSSDSLTPRALKIKSQSFCVGAGSSISSSSSSTANTIMTKSILTNLSSSQNFGGSNSSLLLSNKFQRANSDMAAPPNTLTENQRKKLLWAVSLALQDKKITASHPNFKQFATVLARVVKRIFQEHYQKNTTSNSETMLRLAKKYAYNVISGCNADDIYLQAKKHLDDGKRQSSSRLSGYIGAEEYEQLKLSQQSLKQTQSQRSPRIFGSTSNIFVSENSVDSYGISQFSQSSSAFCSGNGNGLSQSSAFERTSEVAFQIQNSNGNSKSSSKKPIQPNGSLQNSSSKSNLGGLALRENTGSAQKNFTGKDQRNISPFIANNAGSGRKIQSQFIGELSGSGLKAKRQITFDS